MSSQKAAWLEFKNAQKGGEGENPNPEWTRPKLVLTFYCGPFSPWADGMFANHSVTS